MGQFLSQTKFTRLMLRLALLTILYIIKNEFELESYVDDPSFYISRETIS